MVRLVDIAEKVGVSVMTVSKALRDQPDVSAKTRGRIKAAAKEMGYVPDSSAQSLRTRATKLFGLVIPSTTNPVFARMVFALEERAQELGYDLLLCHTQNKPEREEFCIRRLLARRVDGIFVTPRLSHGNDARIYRDLLASKTPTVLLGRLAAFCSQFVSVSTDELAASYAITQHLLELGHRRIAYFTGPLPAIWAQERYEGFAARTAKPGWMWMTRWSSTRAARLKMATRPRCSLPTRNVTPPPSRRANDLIAIGCANPAATRHPHPAGHCRWSDLATSSSPNISGFRSPPFASPNSASASRRWNDAATAARGRPEEPPPLPRN
jgi:DNA-binding LacI/PurR family transcriptional regulator